MPASPHTPRDREHTDQDRAHLELDAIYASAPIGLCLIDADTRFLRVNRRFAEMGGFSVEEILGRRVRDLIPALADRLEELTRYVVDTGEALLEIGVEGETPAHPGALRSWRINAWPVRDSRGQVIAINIAVDETTERNRAEEALQQEKERMGAILTALDTGLSLIDRDMTILWVNQKVRDLFPGRDPVGQKCYRFYERKESPCGVCAARQSLATGKVASVDKYVPGEGSAPGHWLHLVSQPVRDRSGQVTQMLESFTDITPQKKMVEALRESEAKYRSLIDTLQEGVVVIDRAGVIRYANPPLAAMLGYTVENTIGRSVFSFMDAQNARILREHMGQRQKGRKEQYELEAVTEQEVKKHILIEASPVTDEQGNFIGSIAGVMDITERKRTEEALRESEEKYRDLFLNDLTGDFVGYPDGTIQDCNLAFARMFGFASIEEAKASNFLHTFIDAEQPAQLLARLRREKKIESVGTYRKRRDGTRIHVIETLIGIFDDSGALVQLRGYLFEDTERVRAEEAMRRYLDQLKRSNEDLERFAYISSHDLQEPLRTIVSYAQLLERKYKGMLDADADEYLQYLVKGGKRMQNLVHDLLEYSRVNTKGSELRETDASAVVEDTLPIIRTLAEANGATVTYDALPMVMADPTQLRQVFSNLISNAIKFRREGVPPDIHISARKRDGMVQFSVRDNGIGIEPQYFERIFVIFQRLHGVEAYEGTGIGLAIVKRIIERHGGRIWVESEPGQGSTFHFTIPAPKSG